MFKAKLRRVGNSVSVLVPSKDLKERGLSIGQEVTLEFVNDVCEIKNESKLLPKFTPEDIKDIPKELTLKDIRKQIASITSGNSRKPKIQTWDDCQLVNENSI